MKRLIKNTSLMLVLILFMSHSQVFAHNLDAMSDIGFDYSSWESKSPVLASMPTPKPSPTTPAITGEFRELEIARAKTFYEINASMTNRNINMTLATKALDFSVINNGETFSYNEVVGPRTEERGFKEATIFVGQTKVPGIGGGICQISSTLYMAAKKANLQIVERHGHTMPVTYCSPEDEATVVWNLLDFKFKNNTGDPIRIEATCKNGIVCIVIYQRVPV